MHYQPILKSIRYMASLQGDFNWPTGEIVERDGGYFFAGDGYEWTSTITAHKSGVNVRVDKIKNVSDRAIDFRTMLSRFSFFGGEYEVFTQYNEWCGEGYGKWQPLVTEISAEGESVRNNSGASPFVGVYSCQTGRGMVFHVVADSLWTIKVKNYFQSAVDNTVEVELGMMSRGLNYTLMPGEELTLPTVLFYEFRNKTDLDCYKLHRYLNDVYPAKGLPIIYNTWMGLFDVLNFDRVVEQMVRAKKLGAEYFVIDAGWFGPPAHWSGSVGEWEESDQSCLGGRMIEIADLVRANGMKFGLWFEPERADPESPSVKAHPDYYIAEKYFRFLDFGNEEARNFIFEKVAKNIRKYNIEFIKFDFNAEMGYDRTGRAFTAWFEGYRKFVKRINEEFPNVYLENCASGGERMSIASLEGFGSFWASDNHSIYKQVEMYKGNILHMPSRALEKWIAIQTIGDFGPIYPSMYNVELEEQIISCAEAAWRNLEGVRRDYLLSAMMGGPIGITCDLTRVGDTTLGVLADFIAEYKKERTFWMNSECHILCDTESMLVLQFNDEAYSKVKICTFAKTPQQYNITVYPVIEGDATFVDKDGKEYTSRDLDKNGTTIELGGDAARFHSKTLMLTRK
ncbi:MAG: alpha-galactosidase [Clostridia bacterium]|nr:alpha-galactosidase [Clostridia bacterium]